LKIVNGASFTVSQKANIITKEGIGTNKECHPAVKRGKQVGPSRHPHKSDKVVSLQTLFFKNASWKEHFRALLLAL